MRRDQAETRNADQHVAASAEHRIAQDDGVNSGIKRRDLRLDLAQPVTGMALEQLDRQGLEAIEKSPSCNWWRARTGSQLQPS